jgi:hypothetical protein
MQLSGVAVRPMFQFSEQGPIQTSRLVPTPNGGVLCSVLEAVPWWATGLVLVPPRINSLLPPLAAPGSLAVTSSGIASG